MSNRIRSFAALIAAGAILVVGIPAAAFEDPGLDSTQRETPILLDAMVLRPMGLALTALGAAAFVIPGMFTLMTRPTEIGKPFKALVVSPFRYTFMDRLGEH